MNQTSTRPVLIFPAGAPRALEYLERCERERQPVVGASSLGYDPNRERFSTWTQLPFVTEPNFATELKRAIEHFNIGSIFSPNLVVWDFLTRELEALAPGVQIVNESPANSELWRYRSATTRAQSFLATPLSLEASRPARPAMGLTALASLLLHADTIPGMCDHQKTFALCEVARALPEGDIVEIGSWWGKSAVILAQLAKYYRLGNLLCVDPWSPGHLVQGDEKGIVDALSASLDVGEALTIFEMNLLAYSADHVNYLRLPSVEASKHFRQQRTVTTPTFGSTTYQGRVSLLHIDGNHEYSAVQGDILHWGDLVVPDGWIIFDDYVWPYGDGPQRTADEFLTTNRHRVKNAFAMGSALFVQLAAPVDAR